MLLFEYNNRDSLTSNLKSSIKGAGSLSLKVSSNNSAGLPISHPIYEVNGIPFRPKQTWYIIGKVPYIFYSF